MNVKLFLSSSLASTFATMLGCSDPARPIVAPLPDAAISSDADVGRLEITVSAARVPLQQGSSTTLELTVTRHGGANGAVTIAATSVPTGVTIEPVTVAAGATTAVLTVKAEPNAPHSLPTAVMIRAAAGAAETMTTLAITVCGPPGALDTSLGGGKMLIPASSGDDYAHALAVQSDGKLLIAGGAEPLGDFALIRLDRDGDLDATFGTGGRVLTDIGGDSDSIHAVALQEDGKIIVAGVTNRAATGMDFAVARYLTTGDLDLSFGNGGKVVTAVGTDADTAYAVLVQPDGKIVVGGDSNRGSSGSGIDFAAVRYTTSGDLDTSFDDDGVVLTAIASDAGRDSIYALALETIDGEHHIIAAGGDGDFKVARYRANGALDSSFDSDGRVSDLFGSTNGAARAVTLTPTGGIVLTGHAHDDVAIAQLTTEGTLDLFFGTGGKVITAISSTTRDEAQAIAVDSAGKLLVAGWVLEHPSATPNFVVLRYLTNGHLDPAFGGSGIVQTPVAPGSNPDQARALAIQQDPRVPTHRVIVAGSANGTNSDFAVTRYWR